MSSTTSRCWLLRLCGRPRSPGTSLDLLEGLGISLGPGFQVSGREILPSSLETICDGPLQTEHYFCAKRLTYHRLRLVFRRHSMVMLKLDSVSAAQSGRGVVDSLQSTRIRELRAARTAGAGMGEAGGCVFLSAEKQGRPRLKPGGRAESKPAALAAGGRAGPAVSMPAEEVEAAVDERALAMWWRRART